jgi:hypothetical protein
VIVKLLLNVLETQNMKVVEQMMDQVVNEEAAVADEMADEAEVDEIVSAEVNLNIVKITQYIFSYFSIKVVFFKGATPSHDDYGKTIVDI